MATLSSAGIGSGLNVESIVTGLMNVERQPLTQLQTQQSSYQSKISALGTLKSALSSLQSAASALTPATLQSPTAAFASFNATVADSTIASATTTSSAVAGTYSVNVTKLGSSQTLALNATFQSGDQALDFGSDDTRTLTIQQGSNAAVTITLDKSQNTLSALRDAINNAGAGVSASTVTDSNGVQHLQLTADQAGTANAITLGGTVAFKGAAASVSNSDFTETQATDAIVQIQGITVKANGNTVSDAIDGVTLTLAKEGSTSLTLTRDTSALKSKLTAFVNAYNSLNSSIKSLGAYDATSKTGAVLNGDSSLRSVQSQVRAALTGTPSSLSSNAYKTLSSLGISFQSDGSLQLDSTKFDKAASTNFSAVASAISAYGSALKTTTTNLLGTTGVIASRTNGLNASVTSIGKQITALNNRLTIIEQTYRAQFTALDTTMTSMNTTSTYLTQQLAKL
ncbi:MAG: flagellar filament capping protein FliD [Proteobacteria bacterium]|nr:flagellar filament capping protein FliD [Pseudomonadota bacterium]